jgi:enoyl-CoA hydratase/carnithine racemase
MEAMLRSPSAAGPEGDRPADAQGPQALTANFYAKEKRKRSAPVKANPAPNPAPGPSGQAGWISLRQLADGAAQTPLLDADGQLTDPLLVVDLAAPDDPALLAEAIRAARTCERILVGVAPPGERWRDLLVALDVTLAHPHDAPPKPVVSAPDPAAWARDLQAAAASNPQASVALAQVLRAGEDLDVRSALVIESLAYSTLQGGAEFQRWLARRDRRRVPPGTGPAVLVERTDSLLQITLNRPARRNAYSREMRDALTEALAVPALDQTIRQVLLRGAGPSFCSGGDLDEFGTAPDPATAHFLRTSGGAAVVLAGIADRVQALVHGACVGAGIELPAFADRVVAGPGTTFRLPEVAMGLIPGAGGTVSIPRRIGRWRTLYLALSGAPLNADAAAQWGLVDEVRPVGLTAPSAAGAS